MKTPHAAPDARRELSLVRRLATSAVSIAALAALSSFAPVSSSVANAASEQPELVVGSYNIRAGVSTETFRSAVHSMTDSGPDSVDVLGLQEVNSKPKAAVLSSLQTSGWGYYRPKIYTGEQSPLLWRSDRFRLLSARSEMVAGARYIGSEVPARGSWTHPCYVTVVHLRDLKTGSNLSVINVHLPSGAVKMGNPVPGRTKLFRAYRAVVVGLGRLTAQEQAEGQVLVLGDFNIGHVADKRVGRKNMPYKTFGRLGMQSMWETEVPDGKRGSHVDSPALIDQVFSSTRAQSATVRFDTTYSDHFPVVATYPAVAPVG